MSAVAERDASCRKISITLIMALRWALECNGLLTTAIPVVAYNSPMKVPMTEVIAVRRLSWEGEPNREVLVSIGKPAEGPDSQGGFYCPIHTVGLGNDEIVTSIFGVDGFQAIELALRFIGWRLADISSKNGGRLQWLDGQLPKEWAQKEQ